MDPNYEGGRDEPNSQFLDQDCQDGQNWEISVDDYPLEPLESICFGTSQVNLAGAGRVQYGAPQGSSDELIALNGSHIHSWGFGNQSVAETEQPAPEIQQLLMRQLGHPEAFNSIDQFGLLPVSGTQLLENQMPAAIQPLTLQHFDQAVGTADSRSTRTIGESEISEAKRKWRDRKRECDRAYRKREKEKKQKLMDENQAKDRLGKALKAEIQRLKHELEREQQLMMSTQLKLDKLEAEKEYLEGENLLLNERLENSSTEKKQLLGKMKSMKKQIFRFQENMGKLGIKKPKRKLKKPMAETA